MKKYISIITIIILVLVFALSFVACEKKDTSLIPDNVEQTSDGTPVLSVYNSTTKTLAKQTLEDYLLGVVAGEMYGDFPIEALKAQAIVARTYALNFIENRESKYEGADISTDITEAQAYDDSAINDKIRQAVSETRGQVISFDGRLIEVLFHANSGGKTALSSEGLGSSENPSYIVSVDSPENDSNSENYSWSCNIKKTDVLEALRKMGVEVSSVSSFVVGERGESGRATTLIIGDKEVSAATFRLNLGGTIMKSTLIDKINIYNSTIEITGKGYGHGVGMSQWGAKVLADEGKEYKDIINHYFSGLEIKTAY